MPTYDFKCDSCDTITERRLSFKEFDDYKANGLMCDKCLTTKLQQVFVEPPMCVISANAAFDGQRKVVGTSNKNQKARVPINIIDENPDGSCKVTRIGSKGDIDNE